MESASLRHDRRSTERAHQNPRRNQPSPSSPQTTSGRSTPRNDKCLDNWAVLGHEPPKFTVDLSVPPEHRYDHITPHLLPAIEDADVTAQFEELIDLLLPEMPITQKCLHALTRVALRRVYSDEQTAELRGIANATGLSMHILVALNVMLDLLLGCTSGGVRFRDPPRPGNRGPSRVVHFRTLDWGMDPLRSLVIELDYVSRPGEPVLATTVGYFGYVGVLTGVRRGLSVSLNYRPHHDKSSLSRRLAFRWHQLLVVLGRRPSISSALRSFLLPPSPKGTNNDSEKSGPITEDIDATLARLRTSRSTAAYIILCTPQRVYSVEKDHKSASVVEHADFLVTCNHDITDETDPAGRTALHEAAQHTAPETGMDFLVEDSLDRKAAVGAAWNAAREAEPAASGLDMNGVLELIAQEGISNEMTHYAVVMDPKEGKVLWRRAYEVRELGGEETESESD